MGEEATAPDARSDSNSRQLYEHRDPDYLNTRTVSVRSDGAVVFEGYDADKELEQLQSLREYIVRNIYNEHWQKKILEMSLPACGGHNTNIFIKGCRHNRGD